MAKSFFNTGLLGAAGGSVELPSDDQFNRVSFLSHFEGSNNGVNNVFDDGSASNHTITANGDVIQGSFGPFARPDGHWATTFDGANDYLSVADSNDFYFEGGDWTIEAFVFVRSLPGSNPAIVSKFDGGGSRDWSVELYGPTGNGYTVLVYLETTGDIAVFSSTSVALNTWNHIAIVGTHSDRTMRMYLNGSLDSNTLNYSATLANTSEPLRIGVRGSSEAYDFDGEISNLRIVKGTAVYSGSSFTVPTAPLTAITNTKLLTCQSNRFVDNSASGHTVTPSGNAAVTAFGPFLTSKVYKAGTNGASAYFDGSGDRLYAPEDASTRVAASDFTFEAWVYPTTTTTAKDIIFTQGAPNVYSPFSVYVLGTTVRIYISTNGTSWNIASNSTSSNSVQVNAWNHIALVRNGTTIGLYINGVADNTYSVSTTAFFTPTRETSIGGRDGEEYFPGYISDARLVIGTAVYTSAFTPPTAPLTAITNTKLLLNMADGQAIDSAAQNNLTLVGTAKTSTAQKKFGDASLLLDGNSDYGKCIIEPFGTGDFTVECFVRINDKNNNQGFFQIADGWAASSLKGPALEIRSGRWRWFYGTNSNAWHGSAGPAANNTWYHLAFVRNGTTSTFYVDGSSVLTASDSTNYTWGHLAIGLNHDANYYFGGYIDEFRISRMARYTSNFTAPTEPFADKGQDA